MDGGLVGALLGLSGPGGTGSKGGQVGLCGPGGLDGCGFGTKVGTSSVGPGSSVGTRIGRFVGTFVGVEAVTAGVGADAWARHTGESFALGRQSTRHSSPPRKHCRKREE